MPLGIGWKGSLAHQHSGPGLHSIGAPHRAQRVIPAFVTRRFGRAAIFFGAALNARSAKSAPSPRAVSVKRSRSLGFSLRAATPRL
jgi:hypothetical protein